MKKQHPLRRWRYDNEVTLIELADKLGVSQGFMSMVETGDRGVSLTTAARLSKITGLPIEDFVREPA